MSDWLSRAKSALSGHAAETIPVPIELPCPCGRKIEAVRRESFQRVLCKGCGEPFFVLPLDVYPRPVLKKVRPAKVSKTPTAAKPTDTPAEAATAATVMARPAIDLSASRRNLAQAVRRRWTPLRLIVLSLLTVIGLTGWWQYNRAARGQAEIDFQTRLEAGQAALQKKDYVAAAQEFGKCVAAVNLLKRKDVAAEQARQRHRELMAINAPLQRSFGDLLKAAEETKKSDSAATAEAEFAVSHAGRWIVLQTQITPSAASGDALPEWEQSLPFQEGVLLLTGKFPSVPASGGRQPPDASEARSQKSEVRGQKSDEANGHQPPDASEPLNAPNNDLEGREVIFAAQIQSLHWDAQKSVWEIRLNPQSGFLWSDYDLLLATGLVPDELRTEAQLKVLLTQQSHWIGVSE